MHQTTVRFGGELWRELVSEADRCGISVAQYVREAAVARLARSGISRGGESAERITASTLRALRDQHVSTLDSSNAVITQSALAQDRARLLRREAETTRQRSRRA